MNNNNNKNKQQLQTLNKENFMNEYLKLRMKYENRKEKQNKTLGKLPFFKNSSKRGKGKHTFRTATHNRRTF